MTLRTESVNSDSRHIDKLSTGEILNMINAEDAKVAPAVGAALPQIALAVDAIVGTLQDGGRLFYVGAGTSGRLGILDAVECVPTFSASPDLVQGIIAGGSRALTQSVEGAEDDPAGAERDLQARGLRASDVVCGIAASGRTPYVIGALQTARKLGARTIAIACNPDSPIAELAEIGISVDLGPEVISGSTRMKAGSAQKMILNMLSTATMIRLGKVYGNLMVDVKVTNQKLMGRALRLVQSLGDVDEARARQLLDLADLEVKTAIVMGRKAVSAEQARHQLNRADGKLRDLIGDVD
ncbi:MAG: N-acetylmuramic acid 6-phosphate etherase [Chloroflexi bacterium]|nr:N-acetylmuramic acid 6-phosphate etherase [Chloroflexota bacterium]